MCGELFALVDTCTFLWPHKPLSGTTWETQLIIVTSGGKIERGWYLNRKAKLEKLCYDCAAGMLHSIRYTSKGRKNFRVWGSWRITTRNCACGKLQP